MPQDNKTNCAFLDLPPGLRNIVYDYVLATPDLQCIKKLEEISPPNPFPAFTCRQACIDHALMYNEAVQIYFSIKSFSIALDDPSCNSPSRDALPRPLAHLRELYLLQVTSLVPYTVKTAARAPQKNLRIGGWHASAEMQQPVDELATQEDIDFEHRLLYLLAGCFVDIIDTRDASRNAGFMKEEIDEVLQLWMPTEVGIEMRMRHVGWAR